MADSAVDSGRTEAGLPRAKVILADTVAHAVPLIFFYGAHGSVQGYLLLTAFDLALGLMLIVGTTRDPKDPTTVDPRAAWLSADRKSTRLNSSHYQPSRMPSSA